MSWINMLSPVQWIVMAAIPPLILMLYFLKLRRMPVVVPSTYLWQRTVEDLHVNSIWQRLRNNLLLILQLLAVLALILACLRPGVRGEAKMGARTIFMIDHSSSMQATDVDGSRLAQAKLRTLEMIDAMEPSDVGMVIAFSDVADIRQGFTADKNRLRKATESIKQTNRPTDLNEALRAAAGLANPGRTSQIEDVNDIQVAEAVPASLLIFSDGGFAPPQLDLGNLSAEYFPIGTEDANNVAVQAFTVERNTEDDGQIEAFARIENFGLEAVTTTVTLNLDGRLVDASQVSIDAGGSTGVSFELENLVEGKMQLEIDVKDDLEIDNRAYAGLDPPRQLDVVLVTSGSLPMEAALATEQAARLASVRILVPEDLDKPDSLQLANSGTIDLFIYDNCAPAKMPAGNTLFLGTMPPDERWKASKPQGPLFVIDSNKSHPILQYVNMSTVRIVEGQAIELPEGGTELLRTDAGILFGVAPRGAFQDAVVAMPLLKQSEDGVVPNTDWPRKRSFPVFVLNALEYLGGAVSSAGSRSIRPGEAMALNLANRYDKIEIVRPGEAKVKIDRSEQPQVLFTQTEDVGFYQARPEGSEQLLQLFAVNLFSARESNIGIEADVQIGAQVVAASQIGTEFVRVEYWRWLLAIALVILFAEWIVYNRRIAV